MKLFDDLIQKTYSLLPESGNSVTDFPDVTKYIGNKSELILGKELAYELGGSNTNCAVYYLYTEIEEFV